MASRQHHKPCSRAGQTLVSAVFPQTRPRTRGGHLSRRRSSREQTRPNTHRGGPSLGQPAGPWAGQPRASGLFVGDRPETERGGREIVLVRHDQPAPIITCRRSWPVPARSQWADADTTDGPETSSTATLHTRRQLLAWCFGGVW